MPGHSPAPERLMSMPPVFSPRLGAPVKSIGFFRMLVVLVDFTDEPGTVAQSYFAQQFFGTDTGSSFADYYWETSYGQLNLTGDVVGISGGVPQANANSPIFVRLPNPKSFYTANSEFPQNSGGLSFHALQALDSAGFDFAPYANPVTKHVEHLVILFAGKSSVETGLSSDLQPTAFGLDQFVDGGFTSAGGYTVSSLSFCPELLSNGAAQTIGVCLHEHGHGLGLPDMYDVTYQTSGGAGFFDLMAFGLYLAGDGSRPAHFGAYSKVTLGWVRPKTVRSGTKTITLRPVETNKDIVLIKPPQSPRDWFLLENRQKIGFDSHFTDRALCPGLYIWHIDLDLIDQALLFNSVNAPALNGAGHHGIRIIEADNNQRLTKRGGYAQGALGECKDVWKKKRTFSETSRPAAKPWNRKRARFSVEVLDERSKNVKVRIKFR